MKKFFSAIWKLLTSLEVAVVLSGMTTLAQVRENVASACESGVGRLAEADLALVARAREQYEALSVVECTQCGYCMPCPSGVDIPRNMQLYNDALVFKGVHQTLNRNIYHSLPEDARAAACTACRECEEKCPQDIEVSEWMPRIDKQFSE